MWMVLWLTGTPSEPSGRPTALPASVASLGAARQRIRHVRERPNPRAILGPVASEPQPPTVGQPAPLFSLTSVQGATVDLASYRGRSNVVVWFSRGFTCPFCRVCMDGMTEGYQGLRDEGTEIIQVGPNLLQ